MTDQLANTQELDDYTVNAEGYADGATEQQSPKPIVYAERQGYTFHGELASLVRLLVEIGQAKSEFDEISKTKNVSYPTTKEGIVRYKYATLADIDRATKHALAAHGVSLFFLPLRPSETRLEMLCLVAGHGAMIEASFSFYGVSNIKDVGIDSTYWRRYATQCIVNIEGDLDTDELSSDNLTPMGGGQKGSRSSTPRRESPRQETQPARAAQRPAQHQTPEQPTQIQPATINIQRAHLFEHAPGLQHR